MTSPITPLPSVHNLPAGQSSLQGFVQQLRALLARIPQIILDQVVAFIKAETGIDLSSLEGLVLAPIQGDLDLIFNGLLGINLSDSGAVLGAITSAIEQLVATTIQQIIDAVVNTLTGGGDTGNAITGIGNLFLLPIREIQSVTHGLGAWIEELQGLASSLGGRLDSAEGNISALQSATGATLNNGYDNCSTIAGFTTVTGTSALQTNGDSIRTNSGLAAGWRTGPATDKQGIKFKMSRKMPGLCRGVICSDTAMSNYAALEIFADGHGNDYARVVVGSSPSIATGQLNPDGDPAQLNRRISENWVWEFFYDDVTNTYHVWLNGTEIPQLQFTDTANLVTHGSAAERKVGWISNGKGSSSAPGFAVTDYTFYDKAA